MQDSGQNVLLPEAYDPFSLGAVHPWSLLLALPDTILKAMKQSAAQQAF